MKEFIATFVVIVAVILAARFGFSRMERSECNEWQMASVAQPWQDWQVEQCHAYNINLPK